MKIENIIKNYRNMIGLFVDRKELINRELYILNIISEYSQEIYILKMGVHGRVERNPIDSKDSQIKKIENLILKTLSEKIKREIDLIVEYENKKTYKINLKLKKIPRDAIEYCRPKINLGEKYLNKIQRIVYANSKGISLSNIIRKTKNIDAEARHSIINHLLSMKKIKFDFDTSQGRKKKIFYPLDNVIIENREVVDSNNVIIENREVIDSNVVWVDNKDNLEIPDLMDIDTENFNLPDIYTKLKKIYEIIFPNETIYKLDDFKNDIIKLLKLIHYNHSILNINEITLEKTLEINNINSKIINELIEKELIYLGDEPDTYCIGDVYE